MTISKKVYKNLFAFRNPDTGLYWDGRTRRPDFFENKSRGRYQPISTKYTRMTLQWSPKWSKIPIVFRDHDIIDLLALRYHVDLQYFPTDQRNQAVPAKLEMVEFEGRFDVKTRHLDLNGAKEIRAAYPEFNNEDIISQKIRMCLNRSIANAYDALREKESDLSEYQYAIRVRSFKYHKEEHLPFEYLFNSSILFVKSETDVIVAKMALGYDYLNHHCLIDIKPKGV